MSRVVVVVCLALAAAYSPVLADEPREVLEMEIAADIDAIWEAFTTTKRMIALKAVTFPEGFAFVEAAQETWTIFYFSPISTSRTKVTVVGLGYTDSEQSQKMRSFFAGANAYSLRQLEKALTVHKAEPDTQ